MAILIGSIGIDVVFSGNECDSVVGGLLRDMQDVMVFNKIGLIVLVCLSLSVNQTAVAGLVQERIFVRKAALERVDALTDEEKVAQATFPSGVQCWRDIPYGEDQRQRFDVYAPRDAKDAPVIFMVHGGAWCLGDKTARAVVDNKVARWLPRGFIFISVNYRLLPDVGPVEQAKDIARALAVAQSRVKSWGGAPSQFILMGHSAGAHLVAWLSADPSSALGAGAQPWLGAVLLDSAALNVVRVMEGRHANLYDRAFGTQPIYWKAASPFHVLSASATPILAVCSSQRRDSCPQARSFAIKAISLGARVEVLEQNMSHGEINATLGLSGAYTDGVEDFMRSLKISARL